MTTFLLWKGLILTILKSLLWKNCLFDVRKSHRSSPSEAFLGKVFWKYAANLQENTHAEVQFGMGVLIKICCIFSEHLFLKTPLEGCFWSQPVVRSFFHGQKELAKAVFISHTRMEDDFKKESENGLPTKSDGQQNSGNSTPIGLNFQIIMTPPGIMLIINIVSIVTF